jgi:hypothetical protein
VVHLISSYCLIADGLLLFRSHGYFLALVQKFLTGANLCYYDQLEHYLAVHFDEVLGLEVMVIGTDCEPVFVTLYSYLTRHAGKGGYFQ